MKIENDHKKMLDSIKGMKNPEKIRETRNRVIGSIAQRSHIKGANDWDQNLEAARKLVGEF